MWCTSRFFMVPQCWQRQPSRSRIRFRSTWYEFESSRSLGDLGCRYRGFIRPLIFADVTLLSSGPEEMLEGGIPAEKLAIRYNGIDVSSCTPLPPRGTFRSKWKIPSEQPLILFLSRLIPRKGANILIEAFAQACPESGYLVIAGPEGEVGYRAYLEKRTRESSVEARVLFTGPCMTKTKRPPLLTPMFSRCPPATRILGMQWRRPWLPAFR